MTLPHPILSSPELYIILQDIAKVLAELRCEVHISRNHSLECTHISVYYKMSCELVLMGFIPVITLNLFLNRAFIFLSRNAKMSDCQYLPSPFHHHQSKVSLRLSPTTTSTRPALSSKTSKWDDDGENKVKSLQLFREESSIQRNHCCQMNE